MQPMVTKKIRPQGQIGSYFRVITGTDADNTPEILIYGYIGQEDWWDTEAETNLTDIEVVKAIRDLEKSNSRINIRINSPGGSVMHGDPIITAIRNSKSEIHTYVDGMAASMAFDIWISGHKRHVGINSKLMTHATSSFEWGTAKRMRQCADMLDKFDDTAIATFSAVTGMEETEVRERFYDYEDHWMTAKEAVELGLVAEIDNYQTQQAVEEPEKMSFRQLLVAATRVAMPDPTEEEEQEEENEKEGAKPENNWRVALMPHLLIQSQIKI